MANVRTRIAPSPTGHFHLGNARTALYNYLFAKKQDGAFVVRVEDTDPERSKPEFEVEILESLEWLGVRADESPAAGGPFGPYRDSERGENHRRALERLLVEGKAYHCPHSEAELEAEKKTLMATGKNPVHTCQYRDSKTGEGIIRFKTPPATKLNFVDLVRGEIEFESDLIGDFSIARNPSSPLYNFAVTIDDAEMEISHVIRGEDHIPNTPKQILIWQALFPDAALPAYAHLPLILGPDRAKLSSRHGATAIIEFRQAGYLAEAMVNFMALLGWNPGGEREVFSMDELIGAFDLAAVQKSGAVFNGEKLDWLNGEYIRTKTPRELAALVLQPLQKHLGDFTLTVGDIEGAVSIEQPRLKKLTDIRDADFFFRLADYPVNLLTWKQMTLPGVRESLRRSRRILDNTPAEEFTAPLLEQRFLKEIGAGGKGELLWPLRVALSGKEASPGPFEIMSVLGKEESVSRIQKALALIARAPRLT